MISKSRIKLIHALSRAKERYEKGLFVAEGHKLIDELKGHFQIEEICDNLNTEELQQASLQRNPQGPIALFKLPRWSLPLPDVNKLFLALDTVQDPGNLGTIVRLADWYGIEDIICSHETADVFSPKAIQATMGAIARVRVHYTDLPKYLASMREKGIAVYGTFLDGDSIYECSLSRGGIIVMGNEGNGISPAVETMVSKKLLIPSYPTGRSTSESLNVAMATGIICAEFRRRLSI